jgi:hypothetical protein
MATLDDVAKLAAELPQSAEADRRGTRTWSVAGKTFAWERLFSKADIKRFGAAPIPSQPIVAFRVADQTDKEAVLAQGHAGVFTIEHFNGFNAVLVELDDVDSKVLAELVEDAWLAMAPPPVVNEWRSTR